ncbi:hypothetical protein TNCV_1705621 [Trichonephila clavipes]|uniref:Uncharacterized protein n=1 Tax=Trichonephila clavipes TaxID=2585209 RepID=A0A8X6R9I0_TRICX|nr:hypothetical protein TNCV_1705621 [Trichonephila clavipes]
MVAADCNEHAVWFARSSDLSYMDFFFLGHMKSLAYSSSVEDLIALISVAAGRIRDIPGNFQNLRNSMQHYCLVCQTTSGCNFEHLLQYNLSIKYFMSH